jgi:hypothetical protein
MVTLVNRAKMSTSTTGTGTITLGSAETGYQTFADAGVANGDVVRYVIEDGNDWEIGSGTYTATGTTLSRTVSESSNADAALNLTGSAVVFITAAAGDVFQGELFAENYVSGTLPVATGTDAFVIGRNSTASGQRSVALGAYSTASATYSLAVNGSTASGTNSVAILGSATQNGATAIGSNSGLLISQAVGQGAVALGGSYASGTDSLAAAISTSSSSYGATGSNSVAIGYRAKASDSRAVAIGGSTNTAAGPDSVAIGGQNNTAGTFANGSAIASGYDSHAYGEYSIALGNRGRALEDHKYAHGIFPIGSQYGRLVLKAATTDATATAMISGGSSASTDNQLVLPNNSCFGFTGTVIAREDSASTNDFAVWEIKGGAVRAASAATTTLGSYNINKISESTGAASWSIALSADTTNGAVAITVTGEAAHNIRWVATVHTSEVVY